MTHILVHVLFFTSIAFSAPTRVVEKEETITTESEHEREVEVTKVKNQKVVMYIFDHSGSMGPTIEENKQKVRLNLEVNARNNHFIGALFPFAGCYQSDETYLRVGAPVLPAQGNQLRIKQKVDTLKADGNTDLARALRVAVQSLKEDQYADLVVFTDYSDTCGGSIGQLIQELQKREVKIREKRKYKTRHTHVRIHVLTEATGEDKADLKKLAQSTSGRYLDSLKKQTKFLEELGAKPKDSDAEYRNLVEAEGDGEIEEKRTEDLTVEADGVQSEKASQTQKARVKNQVKGGEE